MTEAAARRKRHREEARAVRLMVAVLGVSALLDAVAWEGTYSRSAAENLSGVFKSADAWGSSVWAKMGLKL